MATTVSAPTCIDAVYYMAKDLPRARKFYEETLGLQPVRDYGEGTFVEYDLGDGNTFGIGHMPDSPWYQSGGVMFATPDFEDVVARVKASGVPVRYDVWDGPICTMAWFEDTEGNTFAIHRRK
jgi:predicted enzyme related to lactoylglutathione lyase